MFGTDSSWRQGCLLAEKSATTLFPHSEESQNAPMFVVVTHDCDILSPKEKKIEFIACQEISVCSPEFVGAKNPRKIHLKFSNKEDQELYLELQQCNKISVDKGDLESVSADLSNFYLAENEKDLLKQWLAARYGRPAFPNAFEARLRKDIGKRKKLEEEFRKKVAPHANGILAIFFDLNDSRYSELEDGDPYFLKIIFTNEAMEGGPSARKAAESAAIEIEALFASAFDDTEIILESCLAVADTDISLAALRRISQWRLEHLSYEAKS